MAGGDTGGRTARVTPRADMTPHSNTPVRAPAHSARRPAHRQDDGGPRDDDGVDHIGDSRRGAVASPDGPPGTEARSSRPVTG